ncbi:Ankyrin repeat domain-containing protein [Plasmodiophora brassicae]
MPIGGHPSSRFLPMLIVIVARTNAVTLRSSDGGLHYVHTSAAVAHSRPLDEMTRYAGCGDHDPVCLPGIADPDLRLVVQFMNAIRINEGSRATQWTRDRLASMDLGATCRLLAAAYQLDLRLLMTAIASATTRTWGDIPAMREMLPPGALRFLVDSAPGFVRLARAASTADQKEIVGRIRDLLVRGGRATFVNNARWCQFGAVLHWAVWRDEAPVVELLLRLPGIDVNAPDNFMQAPLHCAATSPGRGHLVGLLLMAPGIDVNARDHLQKTALHVAVMYGRDDVVRMLLKAPDVDVNAGDLDQMTPLHWASALGFAPIVRLLLAAPEIDVDARDRYQTTPLHRAASSGRRAVVHELLLRRAAEVNVEARDIAGRTPLHCAASNGHDDIVEMLLKRRGPPDPLVAPAGDQSERRPRLSTFGVLRVLKRWASWPKTKRGGC